MKLLLIGVAVAVGVGLTVSYFSIAHFLSVNARARGTFAENQGAPKNGLEGPPSAKVRAKKRGVGA